MRPSQQIAIMPAASDTVARASERHVFVRPDAAAERRDSLAQCGSAGCGGPASSFFLIRATCFILLVLLLALPAFSQSEYDVKAAYLYNFGKFVKWPESSTKGPQFLICVMGEDPFNGALESTVTGEKVNDKPAVVLHIDTTQKASACNILFISRSEERRARHILDSIDLAGTLTVSDIPGFLDDDHAMIEFVNQGGRIRFNINLPAAQQAGLTLSSDLLKVASYVKGKP